MLRLLALLLVAAPAMAQRDQVWSNAGLTARGLQPAEQQMMLRQHMSQCHGAAYEGTRAIEDEAARKSRGMALFRRCMAEKGWTSRDPAAPRPPAKAPRATST